MAAIQFIPVADVDDPRRTEFLPGVLGDVDDEIRHCVGVSYQGCSIEASDGCGYRLMACQARPKVTKPSVEIDYEFYSQ